MDDLRALCYFCAATKDECNLFVGQNALICQKCVADFSELLSKCEQSLGDKKNHTPSLICSFCTLAVNDRPLVEQAQVLICYDCVQSCLVSNDWTVDTKATESDDLYLVDYPDDERRALELKYGVSFVDLEKVSHSSEDLLFFDEKFVRKYQAIVIRHDKHATGNTIELAMVNPNDLRSLDELKQIFRGTNTKVRLRVCSLNGLNRLLGQLYAGHGAK